MSQQYVRFGLGRRIEHLVIMITFTLLVLTGMPQKFFEARWAHAIVSTFGGLNNMRWAHRLSGFAMAAAFVIHFAVALLAIGRGRKGALSLVPTRKDFSDAVRQIRYYLRLTDVPAFFDRYDYRQKFEYWGLVVGSVIMIVTGFILFFPTQVVALLPGEAIPAAKLAHGNEGLLAFLTILIWHIYNAHLSPQVFPMDSTIFSGKISRHRMEHEHPLELSRWEAGERAAAAHAQASTRTQAPMQAEGDVPAQVDTDLEAERGQARRP